MSGFYEFTAALLGPGRHLAGGEGEAGDAFSLLTAEPGPDVAPYHTRGVIPLPPHAWADWLLDRRPSTELLVPPPAGTLTAEVKPRG